MDFTSLVETRINLSLLTTKHYNRVKIFYNQPAISILSNNMKELAGKIQKGGVMVELISKFAKHATSICAEPTVLSR